ncbi:hypothetical protein XENTR_v10002219 [Xenopus tropicalis]|nr:hypothetical protein XENTR_v10002219 [Xenopus tropicalis]
MSELDFDSFQKNRRLDRQACGMYDVKNIILEALLEQSKVTVISDTALKNKIPVGTAEMRQENKNDPYNLQWGICITQCFLDFH